VEYLNYLGSTITNGARYTLESKIAVANTAFNRKTAVFTSKFDLNVRKKLI
jgi:hypothetical protein